MLCGVLKKQLNLATITNKEAAIRTVIDAWNAINIPIIDSLCAPLPARVENAEASSRETIQHLLSSRKEHVPLGYLSDRPPPPWTSEEGELLMGIRPDNRELWETTAG
jgi:hypothetical protein